MLEFRQQGSRALRLDKRGRPMKTVLLSVSSLLLLVGGCSTGDSPERVESSEVIRNDRASLEPGDRLPTSVSGQAFLSTEGAALRRDSTGVELIELEGSLLDDLPEWTLSEQPLLTIGGIAAEGPFALNRVSGAFRLPNGTLAVADQSQEIRFFGSDGSFIRQVGGRGEGPGEFAGITFVAYHDAGMLVMDRDLGRATIFASDGVLVETYRLPSQQCARRISHGVGYSCVASAALRDGTIMTVQELGGPSATSVDQSVTSGLVSFIGVMTRDAYLEVDSVVRATQVTYRAHDIPSRAERPFDADGIYTVGRDHIALGNGDRFEIRFRDRSGALVRILRVAAARRAVSRQDLELFRGEEHFRVLLEVAGAADSVPHFSTLRLDDVGRLWVQEYLPVATTETAATWFVFDQAGDPVARVRLPRTYLLQIGPDFVLTRRIGGLGVESVELYSIESR